MFLILLGAVLGFAGTFAAQRYQSYQTQLKEDRQVWFEVSKVLLKIRPFRDKESKIWGELDRMYRLGKDVSTGSLKGVKEPSPNDAGHSVGRELLYLTYKIRSKCHYSLSGRIWRFAVRREYQTNEELEAIKTQALKAANPGFSKYYDEWIQQMKAQEYSDSNTEDSDS